jgi:RNA-directed DNA polymerase
MRAGERVKESVEKYLEKILKLKVNQQKSAVDRPWRRKFLGFSFTFVKQTRIRLHPKSVSKLKEKIRKITDPMWSISMDERIEKLNQYLMGWIGYYALADAKGILQSIEEWTRRRLRLCLWTQWKRIKTKYRELRSLGLSHVKAIEIANTRKGAWRTTSTPHIHKALGIAYWQQQGLKSLVQRYFEIRQAW